MADKKEFPKTDLEAYDWLINSLKLPEDIDKAIIIMDTFNIPDNVRKRVNAAIQEHDVPDMVDRVEGYIDYDESEIIIDIIEFFEQKGYSDSKIAKRLMINPSMVSRYRKGSGMRRYNYWKLRQLAVEEGYFKFIPLVGKQIQFLMAKGYSVEEVAGNLGVLSSEIDVILNYPNQGHPSLIRSKWAEFHKLAESEGFDQLASINQSVDAITKSIEAIGPDMMSGDLVNTILQTVAIDQLEFLYKKGGTASSIAKSLNISISGVSDIRARVETSWEILGNLQNIAEEEGYYKAKPSEHVMRISPNRDYVYIIKSSLLQSDQFLQPEDKVNKIPVLSPAMCNQWLEAPGKTPPANYADSFESATTKDTDAFYLRAVGDSMTGEGIEEGDLLLIEPNIKTEHGCKAVIMPPGERDLLLGNCYSKSEFPWPGPGLAEMKIEAGVFIYPISSKLRKQDIGYFISEKELEDKSAKIFRISALARKL